MIFALFAMLGCAVEPTPGDDSASRAEDPETAECFASYGDNCGCLEQCLTELQTWQAGPGCEAGDADLQLIRGGERELAGD